MQILSISGQSVYSYRNNANHSQNKLQDLFDLISISLYVYTQNLADAKLMSSVYPA